VCRHCGHAQASAGPHCLLCSRSGLETRVSAASGSVSSFTTVYRAPNPAFRARVPYVIVLVDMDEGFRLMLNLRSAQEPVIGQRIQVLFADDGLPVAVPA